MQTMILAGEIGLGSLIFGTCVSQTGDRHAPYLIRANGRGNGAGGAGAGVAG